MVAHTPYRSIAHQYGISHTSLIRHHDDHLPAVLAQAKEAAEEARADDLLAQLKGLRGKAIQILARAEREGDLRAALGAIREARATIELLGELAGELDRRAVVNVTLSAEWLLVRAAILAALAPFPEARAAVAGRLLLLERPAGACS